MGTHDGEFYERDQECFRCAGIGFVWDWKTEWQAKPCDACEGKAMRAFQLPALPDWLSTWERLLALGAEGARVSRCWERGWPRRQVWRIQYWKGTHRWEGRDARSIERALASVKTQGARHYGRAS